MSSECDYDYRDGRCCLRISGHEGEHASYRKAARRLDEADYRAALLDELRRLNASLSALPPVLHAIAGGVLGGPVLATMTGDTLTLADLAEETPRDA